MGPHLVQQMVKSPDSGVGSPGCTASLPSTNSVPLKKGFNFAKLPFSCLQNKLVMITIWMIRSLIKHF